MRANLGRAFGEAWNNYLPNIGVCIAAWIVGFVIMLVTLGLLTGPILGGFFHMGQKMKRGERVDFNDLFFGFSRFGDFFLYGILVFLVTIVVWIVNFILMFIPLLGQIAAIVIGLIYGAVVSVGLVHMVEKNASATASFGEGFNLMARNPMDILVGGGLLTLVSGVFPPLTQLWAITGFFYLYDDLTGGPAPAEIPTPPPPPEPPAAEGEAAPPPPPGGVGSEGEAGEPSSPAAEQEKEPGKEEGA